MRRDVSCRRFPPFLAALFLSVLFALPASAGGEIPAIVLEGLNEYGEKGADGAVKAWVRGSAFENSVEAQSQGNIFRQVETLYGRYTGYEPVMRKDLSPSSTMVYLAVNYERGPLFANFLVYTHGGKSVVAYFNFNTKAEAILPQCYLSK